MTLKPMPSPEEILELIPAGVSLDALRDKGIVPLRKSERIMSVALSDLSAFTEAQLIASKSGMSCEAEIYPASEIQHLIRSLYDIKSGIVQDTLSSIEEVNDLQSWSARK